MGEFSSKLPFFLILHLAALLSFGNARDTIAPGKSINDNQALVSAEGSFQLGFFSPGSSKNRYLGIWYNNISVQTVVWVANRQSPLSDSTGVLKIASNGSLILANGTGTVFWSTPATSARSPVAQLLDNGNFAVLDAANNVTGTYAWQGFDHPTDTLLPGMKIGWDLRIGLNRNITAWKNSDDPAKGNISLTMDTHGVPELFVMAGSVRLSRSGPWVGQRFSGNPEMKKNDMFSFSFVANSDEIYYKFDILNHAIKSTLTVNQLTVNQPGTVQRLVWIDRSNSWKVLWFSPQDQCDIISFCGPYGLCNTNDSPICNCLQGFKPKSSSDQVWFLRDIGCVRKTPLDCQNGTDGFVTVNGAKPPDTSNAVVNVSLSLGDCRIACLSNCSCTGYASSDVGGGNGCIMWFSELTDLRVFMTGGQDLYVRMAAADLVSDHAKQMILWIVVPVAVAVVILLLGLFMCLSRLRNQTHKGMKEAKHEILELEMDTDEEGEKGLEFSLFSFATIEAATGNFLVGNKLGKGGFGPVYKGKLPDGRDIAVKRLSRSSGQGVEEFKNEIRLVAKLQHTNLVRLLGYCIQGEEKLLIYEYMPNKSLDSYLFDPSRGAQLDWRKRFHIIERIAQGVLYLHKYSRLRIIHRDLKASNILLDSDMNPKISDFGMARIFGQNESRANTNRVVGTYGYMSPEYAIHGLFSMKSDVFSFGVLLMEIVTGKRNSCFQSSSPSPNLLGYAWEQWQKDKWLELIDPLLGDTCTLSEVSRCIQVALLCVQESAADRPTMSDVISMLHTETSALPTPKQPAFSFGTSLVEEELPSTRQQIYSANGLTNSNEGR